MTDKKGKKGFFSEFKEFAIKGNVIDLAIGVVIGAAFGSIVNSLINDVITPMILKPALDAAHLTKLEDYTVFGAVHIGKFLAEIINFLMVAIVLFIIIKAINASKRKDAEKPKPPVEATKEEILLTEIRDLLKSNSQQK